jgi:hypothetical protein
VTAARIGLRLIAGRNVASLPAGGGPRRMHPPAIQVAGATEARLFTSAASPAKSCVPAFQIRNDADR